MKAIDVPANVVIFSFVDVGLEGPVLCWIDAEGMTFQQWIDDVDAARAKLKSQEAWEADFGRPISMLKDDMPPVVKERLVSAILAMWIGEELSFRDDPPGRGR